MKRPKPRLRQEILLLIAIKLMAIAVLWWCFVREAHVNVDPVSAADHLVTNLRSPTLPGENHDQ